MNTVPDTVMFIVKCVLTVINSFTIYNSLLYCNVPPGYSNAIAICLFNTFQIGEMPTCFTHIHNSHLAKMYTLTARAVNIGFAA